MRPVPLALAAAVLAWPASAQDTVEQRFVTVVAEHGCKITEDEAERVLPGHGMTMEETEDIVGAMIGRGDATFENGLLTLAPSICTPRPKSAAEGSVEARFIAILARRGCKITESEAAAVLPEAGLTMDGTEELVETLLARGEASFDGNLLTLTPEVCTPVAETPPAEGSQRERFIAIVAAQGCRITEQQAEAVLPEHGMTIDDTEAFVEAMIAAGEAKFEGGTLTLLPVVCEAGEDSG